MANLLGNILKAAGDEEIDLIVFDDEYGRWAKGGYLDSQRERYGWITFNCPMTFDIQRENLNIEIDCGFGGEDHPPFWASTKSGKYILICSNYDGSTGIHRVPTSFQSNFKPEFYGGG